MCCGGADGHSHEGADKAKKGGARPRASSVAMTSPVEEVDRRRGSRRIKGTPRHRSEGFFPPPQLRDLLAWSSGGFTGGQRRRLFT